MVGPAAGTVLDKFKLLKDLGFDGVELDNPGGPPAKEVLDARDKTGLEVPGLVDSVHWRPASAIPTPVVPARASSAEAALKEAKLYGATTVLLVPAVVNKQVSYEDAYKRSQAEIKKVLRCPRPQREDRRRERLEQFPPQPGGDGPVHRRLESPFIGSHFDVGNIVVYGWPEHWIKTWASAS